MRRLKLTFAPPRAVSATRMDYMDIGTGCGVTIALTNTLDHTAPILKRPPRARRRRQAPDTLQP